MNMKPAFILSLNIPPGTELLYKNIHPDAPDQLRLGMICNKFDCLHLFSMGSENTYSQKMMAIARLNI